MTKIKFTSLFLLILFINCSSSVGGSEIGNPPTPTTRTLTGTLTSSTNSLKYQNSETCLADTIIARNSSGQTVTATTSLTNNCIFTIDLTVQQGYEMEFRLNDQFVAYMNFSNASDQINSRVFLLSGGESGFDLGSISFANSKAIPSNQPAEFMDFDGDGIFDFFDTDDDGDGTSDELEIDCDFDGWIDDLDDQNNDSFDCDTDDTELFDAFVFDIFPRPNDIFIDPDELIVAAFNCLIDIDTVTLDTFVIQDSTGNSLACDYDFLDEFDDAVICDATDSMLVDETYSASIDGILCANGDDIEPLEWSWTTTPF